MPTTSTPLVQLERYHRRNRAPAWAPWLGDAPVALAALAAAACGTLLAANALRTLHAIHDGLDVATLVICAGWLGLRIGRGVPAHGARAVFSDWLKSLPIPASALLAHWRHASACRAGMVGAVAALACMSAAGLAGMGLAPTVLAGSGLAAVLACTLAVVLRSPPTDDAAKHGPLPPSRTRGWWSRLDSRRMPHVGAWQLRRQWTRGTVSLAVLASAALLAFAGAWGQAQSTAVPMLVAGLLLAITVFNRSLDCTLLCSPAIRMLPVSGLHKVCALVRLPGQLSLLTLLAAVGLASVAAPDGMDAGLPVQLVAATATAWLLLVLLRMAACVGNPAGGIGVEIRYLAQLVGCAMLLQALQLAGVAAALVAVVFWLRHAIARLP